MAGIATAPDGARIAWQQAGDPAASALLLLNSLGTTTAMWDGVMPALAARFRVIRMDTRGHGASAAAGPCTLAQLADDAVAVLDAAGAATARICGLSLGGMMGLALALRHPGRVALLAACNTSVFIDPEAWSQRAALVRAQGMPSIADLAMERFFSPGFRAGAAEVVGAARATLLAQDAAGYAACCEAIGGMDLAGRLDGLAVPTLVLGGSLDASMPAAAHAAPLARAIPGARLVVLPTGHLSVLEAPVAFLEAVVPFLSADPVLEAARGKLFDAGVAQRRAVLGDDWVSRSLDGRESFAGEFQEFITRVAWGEIWTRPGLDHRTRRLLVLATTMALGRWEEFRLHVRAGLAQDGFSIAELREVLIQGAVYAGVPAANTAFREAAEVLRELGAA